ncbi:MAG TPA: metallopeptidase family protein [Anaeromyxobacteraceae bacterium]|nr:metallopeptidase family protein [Anaeromyxobacteraceae bacterium]
MARPHLIALCLALAAGCARSSASPPAAKAAPQLAQEAEEALDRGDAERALARADEGLRAIEVPPRAPQPDRALAVRLLVAAASAETDLGRADLALPRAERAVRMAPDDPDAAWSRAICLWELCRFDDAEAALRRTLALGPDDAWALHHLGLAAERRGDAKGAQELFARARRLRPEDFPPEVPVDAAAFAAEVKRAVATLGEADRRALASVPLELADLPATEDLVAVEPPLSPGILGLFRGPPEDEPCLPDDGPVCRSIVLYRKNLARFARDRRELDQQIRVTLLHELGHLHGEDDESLRRHGLE